MTIAPTIIDADVIINAVEINDRHGVGILLHIIRQQQAEIDRLNAISRIIASPIDYLKKNSHHWLKVRRIWRRLKQNSICHHLFKMNLSLFIAFLNRLN